MQQTLLVAAVLLFGSTIFASDAEKEPIDKRIQEFTQAFNTQNKDALSAILTQDVIVTSPFTEVNLEGKDETTKFFNKELDLLTGKQLIFLEKSIKFPSKDVAIVQGTSELVDNGKVIRRQARLVGLVQKDGTWYIDTIKEVYIPPPSNMYDHLKELEWLVGNWQDTDQNVSITYSTRWDKYKNFLIQHFRMDVYGEEATEGMQIIGWDPLEQKIRSWIYDSDGGFGSGLWTKQDKSFHAKCSYTLSDGQKAQATYVFTPINSNSYTLTSIDRQVGDRKLPNVEPVTVIKEE